MFNREIKNHFTKEKIKRDWMELVAQIKLAQDEKTVHALSDGGRSLIMLAHDLYGFEFVDELQSMV